MATIDAVLNNVIASSSAPNKKNFSAQNFGLAIDQAINKLDANQHATEIEIGKAVKGQSPDLHQTIVAMQTSEMNFQLALQVRNKLVNAYDEIMRMQV